MPRVIGFSTAVTMLAKEESMCVHNAAGRVVFRQRKGESVVRNQNTNCLRTAAKMPDQKCLAIAFHP